MKQTKFFHSSWEILKVNLLIMIDWCKVINKLIIDTIEETQCHKQIQVTKF